MPTEACSTLKTMIVGDDAPAVVAPLFYSLHLLYPAALVPVPEPAEATATAAFFRRIRIPDRVFAPGVCLDPAFRSLAPPLLG